MDQHTDTSYQSDILKVKQIWNDLKEVQNSSKKKSQFNKHKNQPQQAKKSSPGQIKPKPKDLLNKTKSHHNINPQKSQEAGEIISFSTVSGAKNEAHKKQQLITHPNPNTNSKYVESFNFRAVIEQKDRELSLLRVTNQRFKDQIHRLEKQIEEKDSLISKLKNRQHELLGVTSKFNSEKTEALTQSVEYINHKNDSRRLLKMLESTQEYHYFARLGLEDDGVRFLSTMGKKSSIDASNEPRNGKPIHFCSCNSQFIPEVNFWVPQKVYDFSSDYVKKLRGEVLSEAEVQLLLYELNKIWRERQKRIINTLNVSKALEVGKYKRKIQEMDRLGEEKKKNSQ